MRPVLVTDDPNFVVSDKLQKFVESQHAAIEKITAMRLAPMDDVCRLVIAFGYQPNECLFQYHPQRDVFVVRGVPWFEVEWKLTEDMQFVVTSKWLVCPVPANQCASGTAHAPMIGFDTEA